MCRINKTTRLDSLGIPHWDMILEEKFLISFLHQDLASIATVEQLAEQSAWDLDSTIKHLDWLVKTIPQLPVAKQSVIQTEKNWEVLDVSLSHAPLPKSLQQLPHQHITLVDFIHYKQKKLNHPILIHGDSARQILSAALYLREQGFSNAHICQV